VHSSNHFFSVSVSIQPFVGLNDHHNQRLPMIPPSTIWWASQYWYTADPLSTVISVSEFYTNTIQNVIEDRSKTYQSPIRVRHSMAIRDISTAIDQNLDL
jgi:hypothetical protein